MGLHHSPGPALVGSQTGDAFPPISQDEGKLEVDQPARMTAWFCLPGLPRVSQDLTLGSSVPPMYPGSWKKQNKFSMEEITFILALKLSLQMIFQIE